MTASGGGSWRQSVWWNPSRPPLLLHLPDLTSTLSNTSDSECYIADNGAARPACSDTGVKTRGGGTQDSDSRNLALFTDRWTEISAV